MSLAKEMTKQVSRVIRDKTIGLSEVANEGVPAITPVVGNSNCGSDAGAEENAEDAEDIQKDYEASVWAHVQMAALILKSGENATIADEKNRGGNPPGTRTKWANLGGGSKRVKKGESSSRTVSAERDSE